MKEFFTWRPDYVFLGFSHGNTRRFILRGYKEIYLWPAYEARRIYWKYSRIVAWEYHRINRTIDKQLLKDGWLAMLKKDLGKLTEFRLVGVHSTRTGRPDWGWYTDYKIFIKSPKKTINVFGEWPYPTEEQRRKGYLGRISEFQPLARTSLNAILELPYEGSEKALKTREVILRVTDGQIERLGGWLKWRDNLIDFLWKVETRQLT